MWSGPARQDLMQTINDELHLIEHEKATVTRGIEAVYPNKRITVNTSPKQLLEKHGQGNLFVYCVRFNPADPDDLTYSIEYYYR